jgi:hypothetical protein
LTLAGCRDPDGAWPIIGGDGVHGFKETPQVAFIEGAVTDKGSLDMAALASGRDLTVTLSLSNGKVIVLRNGWFASDGTASTEESEIPVRWEGANAEEIS